jgi:hypothetical protein
MIAFFRIVRKPNREAFELASAAAPQCLGWKGGRSRRHPRCESSGLIIPRFPTCTLAASALTVECQQTAGVNTGTQVAGSPQSSQPYSDDASSFVLSPFGETSWGRRMRVCARANRVARSASTSARVMLGRGSSSERRIGAWMATRCAVVAVETRSKPKIAMRKRNNSSRSYKYLLHAANVLKVGGRGFAQSLELCTPLRP